MESDDRTTRRAACPGRTPARAGRSATGVLRSGITTTVVGGLVCALVVLPGTAHAAPAARDVPGLIQAVADAGGRLDAARSRISAKREGVNKTLVDLQLARVGLDDAIAAADDATGARERADRDVVEARGTLDDYARMLYRQGTAPGAASRILDSTGPDSASRREEMLRRAAADQRSVVGDMERSKDAADAREHEANDARQAAQGRFDDASRRRDDARSEIAAVTTEVKGLEDEVRDLTDKLRVAQADLDAQRGPAAPTAPAGPATGTTPVNQDVVRAEAAARLAGQPQTEKYAAAVAASMPGHLDLGDIRGLASGSAGAAGQAARGAAGAVNPGSVENAVGALDSGDTDQLVQQVVDAVVKASGGSSEQGPGTPNTSTPRPTAGQSTPASAAPTTAASSTTKPSTTKSSTPTTGTGATGDAATRIQTVIDRARSQLGMPYAWGGGDAKGPTLGIRDGGVADSYGDYAKRGFDCSGLMIYAFAGVGIQLAHYTGYQYTAGTQVPVGSMRPGDMLFWGPGASEHVALYIGNNQMIEAPQSGDVVKISPVRRAGMTPYAVRMIE